MHGSIDCYGLTDVGCKRDSNEDQFLIADLNKSLHVQSSSFDVDESNPVFGRTQARLLVVADGMGGHFCGERASQLAVETIAAYMLYVMPWFYRLDQDHDVDYRDELNESLLRCHQQIAEQSRDQPRRKRMGTTLTMAYVIWPRMYIVHAGDSRCYLHRSGHINQITTDHTVAEQIRQVGLLPEGEIGKVWQNTLWNVLGGNSGEVRAEISRANLRVGDSVLLCSDGLTQHVNDDAIASALSANTSARTKCEQLVEAAKSAGGSDNVTVVIARFLNSEHASSSEITAAEKTTLSSVPNARADTSLQIGGETQLPA